MISAPTSRPRASAAPYPNVRSAARLKFTTCPDASIVMTASSDDASIACSSAAACGSPPPPIRRKSTFVQAPARLRVVIAEDQPLLRDAVASLLELSGFDVVGRCENADDLLLKARSYRPDVAIVDIRMPPTY